METWFLILIALCISFLIKSIFNLRSPSKKLPPGPFTFPIIGNIHWLRKSLSEIEPILRNLHAKFGPVVTLHIGPRPSVFISDRSLAHQALIQNGAVFSDRPPAFETNKIVSSNQHSISSAFYGPIWRLFRRNLTSEILHPSRIKSYSHARKWVLDILINRLKSQSGDGKPVKVVDHFQYAMFCLLVLMCFGDKLDEKQIEDIERAQRNMLLGFGRYNILNFWPKLTRIFLRKKWEEFLQIRNDQEQVLIPLINARKKAKKEKQGKHREEQKDDGEFVLSYVDTLLELQLPEEKRNLDEGEIVSLSSEFLNTGTDTTSTALQWIMANLVKSPHIQQRVFSEIKEVIGSDEVEEIKEEELHKMKYLKGVILEGLRRHPPGHFVVPHAVTRDIELGGYVVPKKGSVNFMVAEMGWDPKVWEKPMEFKPERFMNEEEVFDITGSREIKMMPFGAGRRICPGLGLAMLHLEYFVANLVWKFEWKAIEGDPIDLSEKQEFTMVMKNPLQACLFPRFS